MGNPKDLALAATDDQLKADVQNAIKVLSSALIQSQTDEQREVAQAHFRNGLANAKAVHAAAIAAIGDVF